MDTLHELQIQAETLESQLADVRRRIRQIERQAMLDTLATYFQGMTTCRIDWRNSHTGEYKRGAVYPVEKAHERMVSTIDYTEEQHGNMPAFVDGAILLDDWRVTIEAERAGG